MSLLSPLSNQDWEEDQKAVLSNQGDGQALLPTRAKVEQRRLPVPALSLTDYTSRQAEQ